MKTYGISEIYGPVVQGEGSHSGYPCLVLRFSGCNLWTDASKPSPTCSWCDTPNLHNSKPYSAKEILRSLLQLQNGFANLGLIVTGGEPFLQLNEELLNTLAGSFAWVDIETNGTINPEFTISSGVSISCSPKTAAIRIVDVDWFKVLVPDKAHLLPLVSERAKACGAEIFIQPVEQGGPNSEETKKNVEIALHLCYNKGYRLSVQLHKYLGLR